MELDTPAAPLRPAAGKLQMHLAVKALNFGMLPVFKISLALDRPQDCAGFNVSICSEPGSSELGAALKVWS